MTLRLEEVGYSYPRSRKPALTDVSLNLSTPATVLLGPNGAGKSTLMKVVTGLVTPQHGAVTAPSEVGYAPQHAAALRGFTCLEQVTYAGWLQGLSTAEASKRALEAIELVRLHDELDSKAARISGGQLRRLGIAEALVASRELVLLDEPSAGLDPEQRHNLRCVLQDVKASGVQLLVSTHQTDDLVKVYETVVVIHGGSVLFNGPVDDFLRNAEDGSQQAESAYLALIGQYR